MLQTLKRVRGAVSSKDLVPVLTHFCIAGGRIQGSNGRITIDAPLPELPLAEGVIPAEKLIKAVDACGDKEPTLTLEGSQLTLRQGRFRAKLPCLPVEVYPREERGVYAVTACVEGSLLDALRKVKPFISQDASRPWSCSVLLREGYAYATNNVCMVRAACPWSNLNDDLILPAAAVDEFLRIGENPRSIEFDDRTVLFEYDGWWMKSRLNEGSWPDISGLVRKMQGDLDAIPVAMEDDIRLLMPFFPDPKMPVVLFDDGLIQTLDGEHTASVNTVMYPRCAYRVEALLDVLSVATSWDLSRYPEPAAFAGPGIEGLMSGVRV